MIKIGHYNKLRVSKFVDYGLYLDDGNDGEILLPKRYMPENIDINQSIDVFIYADSDDTLIATTLTPFACVGEAAYLRVAAVNKVGAFLDWGLPKDLFVPFAEQHRKMEVGKSYIVYIYLDKYADRIVASSKINKFIKDEATCYTQKQPVDLLIATKTELGYKAIINHRHFGLLYKSDLFHKLNYGQKIKGYINNIRPDNRIDLALQISNQGSRNSLADQILDYLKSHNGQSNLTDKSKPEDIYKQFAVSKSNYKKALGGLYKKRLIKIEKDRIRLL
ncbi:GntR family transcriptional regulator [Beggiatoa alba]|nr:GntR family transcriptional regulator [Beggiatoa alba]